MSNRETAIQYLNYFCNGHIDALGKLLSDDFRFSGPSFVFDSKDAYLASLEESPPKNFNIEMLHTFEDGNEVGLFYMFSKPGVKTAMAQLFKFNGDKITETLLIFNGRLFDQN